MKRISPLRAIRLKCLDCCVGSSLEVKLCTAEDCPLYLFRFGRNPALKGTRKGNKGNLEALKNWRAKKEAKTSI